MKPLSRSSVLVWSGAILLALAGCSKPSMIPNRAEDAAHPNALHVDVSVRPAGAPILRSGQPVVLLVSDFTDARPTAPGRKIGDIRATVLDMHGTGLFLHRDAAAVMGGAVKNQLVADGFRLAARPEDAHDFQVSGTIKAFALNVAGRDELNLAVETTLRDGKSGQVLWSGLVTEKSDRYAGVTGNSRETLTEYLDAGLAELAAKTSASIRDALAKSYPQTVTVSRSPGASSLPGVTSLQEAVDREAPGGGARTIGENAPAGIAASSGTGRFMVSTVPSRAKVYIGDVYYGMSPLKLDLEPGVHLFRFKLDGYKVVTEKVSIRRGETTELEVKLVK